MHLRNLFTTKYGKEFVAAAMEFQHVQAEIVLLTK
jgi:hypothetical protein